MSTLPTKPSSVPNCPSSLTTISAPAPQVSSSLLDTSTWPSWNPFVPTCTITSHPNSDSTTTPIPTTNSPHLQVGTRMTFHCVLFPSLPQLTFPQRFTVTEIYEREGAFVVRWAAVGVPGFLLRTDRVHVVRPRGEGEGECEVETWDAMEGVVAWVIRWTVGGKVQGGIERWVEGLKRWCEKGR